MKTICENRESVIFIIASILSIIEYWLGRTKRVTTGSILETIFNLIFKKPVLASTQTTTKEKNMESLEIRVAVPKETHELGQGIIKFLTVSKKALDDGFQIGQDGGAILASLMSDLAPAFDGIGKISEEVKSTKEFATAGALFGIEVYEIFKK